MIIKKIRKKKLISQKEDQSILLEKNFNLMQKNLLMVKMVLRQEVLKSLLIKLRAIVIDLYLLRMERVAKMLELEDTESEGQMAEW